MRRWITEHMVPALTLIGLVFYGGTLLAYSQFYGVFGVEPEDAGADYKIALVRAIPAFFSWVLAWAVTLLFAVLALAALILLWLFLNLLWLFGRTLFEGIKTHGPIQGIRTQVPRFKSRLKTASEDKPANEAKTTDEPEDSETPTQEPAEAETESDSFLIGASAGTMFLFTKTRANEARRKTNTPVADYIILVLGGLVLLFFAMARGASETLADRVQKGHEIRPTSLFADVVFWPPYENDFISNPLRIRVENVVVSPAAGQELPKALQSRKARQSGRVFSYLGRAGDTIVLYDTQTNPGSTLRVPAGDVLLSNAAKAK
jgi:hypothetical protein